MLVRKNATAGLALVNRSVDRVSKTIAFLLLSFLLDQAHSTVAKAQNIALLLYGGAGHKDFLGCLNCNQFDSTSVCNEFGPYGSEFSTSSIWNEFSSFGSEFSSYSPWNEFSSTAPAIVDKNGNFYGYFSANEFHQRRTRITGLLQLFELAKKAKNRKAVRDLFCND